MGGARRVAAAGEAVVESIRPYWRIVRLLPAVSPGLTGAVALAVLVGGLLPLLTTVAVGTLVGAVPAAVAGGPESPAARTAFGAVLVVGQLFVLGRLVGGGRSTLTGSLGRRLDEHLRERVMRALNRPIGVAHLEDPETRDTVERAQDVAGGGWSAGGTVGPLASAAGNWLQSIGSTLILARFSVPLALGWLAIWVVASHFLRREYLRVTKVGTNQAKFVRRANYFRELVVAPAAGKEVRVWGLLGWLTDRFTEEWRRVMGPIWEERARGNRVHAVTAVALQAVNCFVLGTVGLAAARGEIDLAALTIYVGAAQGVGALHSLGVESFALAYGTASVPAVLELERLTAEAAARDTLRGTVSPEGMPRQGIRLEGVTFRYPGRETDALRDLHLEIPSGRSLAIVGANGAGKTTLVKLLGRFYDPTAGRILVDGVPLERFDPEEWRARLSAAFQDFQQFQLLVRETVGVGYLPAIEDGQSVRLALARAGAEDVAPTLPAGLETQLGKGWEGGVDLSGGQWQRLALGRAFMRWGRAAPPLLLIFDEPTAAIDAPTEHALFERLAGAARSGASAGTVTLLVSHRFSTVRLADLIVVLEGGRIVEQGSHQELLRRGGLYAELYALQARAYR